jgi:Leucine-rich repeat (LRR) protein
MQQAKSLESLHLFMLPIHCEFLDSLSSDYLRFVTIQNCRLDDRSLLKLRSSRNILELYLDNNQLTGSCVDGILRMPSLKILQLCGNRIPGRDLERLSSHPSLESIVLGKESIENLEDWKALERLGNTAYVTIHGTRGDGDFAFVNISKGWISVSIWDGKSKKEKFRKTLSALTELDLDLFD